MRDGHDVEFISANNENPASIYASSNKMITETTSTNKIRSLISKVLSLSLPDGRNFFRALGLWKKINRKDIDLTISIGLPFSTHLMTALAVKTGKLQTKKLVADYGDPFSSNPSTLKPFYAKSLERWTLHVFDMIAIPTENAIAAYKNVCPLEKIVVIPQGYNINQDFTSHYKKHSVPNFCFAGNLYKKIRNPKSFFDYLTNIEKEFQFHIYTDFQNTETIEILNEYREKLKNRLILHSQIPRQQCIKTLSEMDFLINFSNKSASQMPSKIIDYTLSSRPFINISQDQKTFEEFNQYLTGDFSEFLKPDISQFDEKQISEQFLRIYTN
ncbi:hypothetical protein [Pseudomonas sp. 65/3-MNA-CIBAN-0223]|uniref:hypothetical protein n=1 Tax=Pseudomonas sp. 65/3-MNA-CIBAN-0223 TaxID=3140476 RepID=UPI0033194251